MAIQQTPEQGDVVAPKRWRIENPNTPNARWVPIDAKMPWQTTEATDNPDFVNLDRWLEDIQEWGLMMREAVIDLRKRVADLEARAK